MISGIADYKSELNIQKFKILDPIWWTKMQNLLDCTEIWYSGVSKVAYDDSELNIQTFKMADPIRRNKMQENYLIGMKFSTRRFLGSLITNPSPIIRNLKCGIQYSRAKFKNLPDWDKIWYLGVFGVVDYESDLSIQKFIVGQNTKSLEWNLRLRNFWDQSIFNASY